MTIAVRSRSGHVVALVSPFRAFPVKVTAPDLNAGANEIAIEALEVKAEGVTLPCSDTGNGNGCP